MSKMRTLKIEPGKMKPEHLSRRQRHMYLNRMIGYDANYDLFIYISTKDVEDSQLILAYKDMFLRQVYGKHPFNPEVLTEMLNDIQLEMDAYIKENAELCSEVERGVL